MSGSLLRPPPRRVTVQVDTREKYPILFPASLRVWRGDTAHVVEIDVERTCLATGDYRLKEAPDVCIVERKGSPWELAKNLLDAKDHTRQMRAFGRLVEECDHPYLLVEATPGDFFNGSPPGVDPDNLLQRLFGLVGSLGRLSMLVVPKTNSSATRRSTGRLVANLLVSLAMREIEKE